MANYIRMIFHQAWLSLAPALSGQPTLNHLSVSLGKPVDARALRSNLCSFGQSFYACLAEQSWRWSASCSTFTGRRGAYLESTQRCVETRDRDGFAPLLS